MDRIRQCHFPLPNHHARHCPQHELYYPVKTFLMIDAVVVIAGVGLFAFVWWWAGARHYCIPFVLNLVNCRYWAENEYAGYCWTGGS
jgi:hypothetical protein